MFYEPAKNNHGLRYNPIKALVAPRPIGWISTMDTEGRVNLSPYSFFNILAVKPDIVGFSSEGVKDSAFLAQESGEFVCNLATWDLRAQMNESSAALPRGEDEMRRAGLESAASHLVQPPRVKASPVALECKWLRTIPLEPLGGKEASYHLVLGQVVGVFIDDGVIADGMVDTAAMRLIARAGYNDYFVADAASCFSIDRPTSL